MEKMWSLQSRKNKHLIMQILFLAVATLILIAVHALIRSDFGDDMVYRGALEGKSLGDFLRNRYEKWSSRVVIEAVMMPVVAANIWVWRIVNSIMILILVWNTGDLFAITKEDSLKSQGIFFALMWTVPFVSLSSAGWMTTTINYLWPLSLGLLAMRPIKHALLEEKCALWEYVLCPICVIFAANMEQMGAILFGAYLVFGGYLLLHKRKIYARKKLPVFYVILFGMTVASLAFVLSCPGNATRTLQETERFFPEFASMNLAEKALMGFLETSHYYLAGAYDRSCIVFAVLAVVLVATFLGTYRKEHRGGNKLFRGVVVAIPLLSYLMFAHFFVFLLGTVQITRARNLFGVLSDNRQIPGQSYFPTGMVLLQTVVYLTVLVALAAGIYFLHGRTTETLLELIILAAGFASRFIVGFSPTVYASGDRTALFCSAALLIVASRNIQFLIKDIQR